MKLKVIYVIKNKIEILMSKSKRTIIKIVFLGVFIVTGFLIIAPSFFAYRGPVVKENENNASASFVSLRHVANEKYVIDKKESVVTWKGSKVFAPDEAHIGNVYISKGELVIEKGQLVGGKVEI